MGEYSTYTHYITFLHQATPPTLWWDHPSIPPSHSCLSPSATGPLPQKPFQTPVHTTSPDLGVLQSLGSGNGDKSNLTKRPYHAYLKYTTFRPGSKLFPQQTRKPLKMTSLKDKVGRTKQQNTCSTHWRHSLKN